MEIHKFQTELCDADTALTFQKETLVHSGSFAGAFTYRKLCCNVLYLGKGKEVMVTADNDFVEGLNCDNSMSIDISLY